MPPADAALVIRFDLGLWRPRELAMRMWEVAQTAPKAAVYTAFPWVSSHIPAGREEMDAFEASGGAIEVVPFWCDAYARMGTDAPLINDVLQFVPHLNHQTSRLRAQFPGHTWSDCLMSDTHRHDALDMRFLSEAPEFSDPSYCNNSLYYFPGREVAS